VRSRQDVIYRDELSAYSEGLEVIYALTRSQPAGWTGYARRVDEAMLAEVAWPAADKVFGTEMTTATGLCGTCGAISQVAELAVYLRGLGTVVRCRSCDNVLMVFVQVRGVTCVNLEGLASLAPA
jgi:NAD(P)H-flavin reductase